MNCGDRPRKSSSVWRHNVMFLNYRLLELNFATTQLDSTNVKHVPVVVTAWCSDP